MEKVIQQANKEKEDKISKIVDSVLKQVFGEEATSLIYKHLEKNRGVKPNEISEKIEVFAKGLEEFLSSGAYVIEKKILEDICSTYGLLRRLELERMQEEFDFVNQLKSLKQEA